jgi:hypothetical protein
MLFDTRAYANEKKETVSFCKRSNGIWK